MHHKVGASEIEFTVKNMDIYIYIYIYIIYKSRSRGV